MGKLSVLQHIFGGLLKTPMAIAPNAGGANEFGGRTTLNSGSVTKTISTAIVNSDSLIFMFEEGNANYGMLAGVGVVFSGSLSGTVSNAAIAADSLAFLTSIASKTNQSSGVEAHLEVHSLGAGSLDVGFAGGQIPRSTNTHFNYLITPAGGIPATIEVKSISSGNFFTIGRSDGVAVARDTIVMWQLFRSS